MFEGEGRPRLDQMSTEDLVRVIHAGDREAAAAVDGALNDLGRAVDAIAERLGAGGGLMAVGAGTSGRLAALDAAELGPTYDWPAERWRTEMAGGPAAFWVAQEGAEDDEGAGRQLGAQLTAGDCLLAVAASGATPFVGGALQAARSAGALTVGIFCQDPARLDPFTDIPVHLVVGPEVVRGSTRMKAGTAQKMALTLLSTGVMVRLGRVWGDLMVDMRVTNQKLRRRAAAFVEELAGCSAADAETLLAGNAWSVRRAAAASLTGLSGVALTTWLRDHPDLKSPSGS